MTSAPEIWPFDARAFLGDTEKLTAAEVGAYIRLLIFYWHNAGLPADDDEQLRRIARLAGPAWRRSRPRLAKLFRAGWRHARADRDLAAVARLSAKKRAAANVRWKSGRANLMNETRTRRPGDNVESTLTHESSTRISRHEQNQALNANPSHAPAIPSKKMNIDSSFGARGNRGSVDKSENGRQARALPNTNEVTPERRRRAQHVWENGVRAWTDRNGIDYAHAIEMLGGDPDLCERITTAELVKPGSGLQTALWALSEMIVGRQ